jgi:hypothetical protein
MLDFNTEPYNDDFDEENKFHRILFRPSFAVQARELTQLQSILQNQIKRGGDHLFKQGAMIIPGQLSIDCNVSYIKLQPLYAGNAIETYLTRLEGQDVTGANGLQAKVIKVISASGAEPATLYVRYKNSANDNTTQVFADSETITPDDALLTSYKVQAIATASTGIGSTATIERGVYYVNGYYVLCDAQTIVLDKYTNVPTYRIGLTVDEQLITPEDTGYESLLDNAQNSYNYAAPGAHRYYIDLVLDKKAIDSTADVDFIELLRVDAGAIIRHTTTTEYNVLEKTLARRTYDESGNYAVRPFKIDIREHRNNNRGAWVSSRAYLIGDIVTSNGTTYVAKNSSTSINTTPTHTSGLAYDGPGSTGVQWEYNLFPYYNRGVFTPANGGDSSKLAVGLEPGKAYVQGYEIEKVATEYIAVNKAREFVQVDNAIIPATVGNYVIVDNINNLPPVNSFAAVTIYNRYVTSDGAVPTSANAIGTARIRGIEWHNGTIASGTEQYKVFLFDVNITAGYTFHENAKSFYFNVSSDANLSFTADIVGDNTRLIGSVTSYTSNTYGTQGSGTFIQGLGTSFQTDLTVGDWVYLGTNRVRVTSIVSQTRIEVASAVNVIGVTVDEITAELKEPENTSLIYKLPYYAIKSVRSSGGTNDTTYTVMERFTGTTSSASGGNCTLTVTTSSGTFASAAETDNYLLMCNDSGSGGAVVLPSAILVSDATVQFTLSDTFASQNFIVIGTVNKSGATLTEKTKTLASTTTTFTTAATATKTELLLGKADAFRLISVKMDAGTFASAAGSYTIDITDRYEFDDGQRHTHYDVARLLLKASYVAPTAPISVEFEYFTHSTGDYFTVNSYPGNVAYETIPVFNGTSLRDTIDFRPRIDDAGATFSGSGSSGALVPKRGIDIRADFTYYLARKTKIAVDFNGNFFPIDGVSSLTPGEPLDPSLGMVLYNLTLEPYTFSTTSTSVVVGSVDNKRYTMRDIGKLEKRIDNLEYYTSLSLLEQQTESLNIVDTAGLDRFKNGFIVDSFAAQNIGDVTSPDYLCSIDMEKGELRPFYSMQNINLIEKNSSDADRIDANYKLYGDVITLPIVEHVPLVNQEYASRLENINPFAIFTFLGQVTLTPSSDDWFEVERRPDIVNQVEGNFNAVKAIAERAGVLGTVWNAWQNQWTGAAVSSRTIFTTGINWAARQGDVFLDVDAFNARFGRRDAGHVNARQVVAETVATQIGQTRTGVKTTLVSRIDREIISDRILSTAVIPYIRSRNILVQVKGLKPNTRFYPYFDDVTVSQFCTPASKLTYLPVSGQFDDSSNVGGLSSETARRINGDSQVCLNRGDVITGATSGATAIVVGQEYNAATGIYSMFVQNVKGTFSASEQLEGSISAARGTFSSLTTTVAGDNLVSNFTGDLNLIFNIPNSESVRFRTGTREFKLVDNVAAQGDFTSRGRALYRAEGILETRQSTVNAVRNAQLAEEQLVENQVIVESADRVVSDTGWWDPLAQTFLVQQKGGAFLTKIDIFFASKDENIPVNLEIREVVNGYPGKLVLPFSKVSVKSADVNISSNVVSVGGVPTPKYDTPTTFEFPSPVYVQDNGEYAIILSSDSNNYQVWISQIGDLIPGSNRTISEQPYMGVFFKSQNASTWTADQNQDLKFTIYRAKFETDVIANVEFVNDVLPYQNLATDPFEIKSGVTKVRVYQTNHGMPSGSRTIITSSDQTQLTGTTGTGTIATSTANTTLTGVGTAFTTQLAVGTAIYNSSGSYIGKIATIVSNTSATFTANATATLSSGSAFKYVAPIFGVPAAEIYTTQIISDVDLDSYCITVSTTPTSSGYTGGGNVRATRNLQYDGVQPTLQIQTFSETMTTFGIKTTTGKSVDSSTQSAYTLDSGFTDVLANENNYFPTPRMVASEINEDNSLSGNKSAAFNVTMSTTNDSLSPILDTHRISLIGISNKINAPTSDNMNIGGIDDKALLSANTTIAFSGSTITSTNATARGILQTIAVGKYLTISGSTSGLNDGTFLVTKVADNGTTATVTLNRAFTTQAATPAITLSQKDFFVDEIAPIGSSAYSKYVTKKINLANTSHLIRVQFGASIPADSSVDVYYKTAALGSNTSFDTINWTQISPDSQVVYVQVGSDQFIDTTFTATDISAFDSLQIKLVMKSTNSAAVPRVKDLRVIACA